MSARHTVSAQPFLSALLSALTISAGLAASGCDAGKAASQAVTAADRAGTATPEAFDGVCATASASPSCPAAKKRAAQLRLSAAISALEKGDFAAATTLAEAAAKEPTVQAAATALLAAPELTVGKRFVAAKANADKAAAAMVMREVASANVPSSPEARAWLAKEEPGSLLANVKTSCGPEGKTCFESYGALVARYPKSPETTEAKALADAHRARFAPQLKAAEGFLIQRLELYQREGKVALCQAETSLDPIPADTCQKAEEPAAGTTPTEKFLRAAWEKNIALITDPGVVARLEARWERVGTKGENDPDLALALPKK